MLFLLQPPRLSGCDGIVSLRMCYKHQAQKMDTWSCIEVRSFTKSQYAIVQLDHGLYDVKVVAINNENLSSASKIVTANLSTCECLPYVNHEGIMTLVCILLYLIGTHYTHASETSCCQFIVFWLSKQMYTFLFGHTSRDSFVW